MNKPSISKKSRYTQGIFIPKNPEKYIGSEKILYRSGWELKCMRWFDKNPSVISWNSEQLVVKYFSPLDNKEHRYYIDFLAKMKLRDGTEKTYAIEVKPLSQTLPSKARNKQRLITETMTYVVNQAKWKAATEFCKRNNIEFIVITEKDLNI